MYVCMYVYVFLAPYIRNNIGNKFLNIRNDFKCYKFASKCFVSLAGLYTALQILNFVETCIVWT